MPILSLIIVVLLAAFVQSLLGFGLALTVMPLATILFGVRIAAPLVSLVGLTAYTLNLFRYWRAIDRRELLRLGLASALGIPVGMWLLYGVDEGVVNRILGLILVAFAAYGLLQPKASYTVSQGWVYPAGFLAGCLGGAYNTPGPPVIVYGSLRQWPKEEFRAILQALFFLNATLVVASHAIAGHLTSEVLIFYLYAVPALLVGILLGSRVDRKVNRDRFRLLVTVLILVAGLALLLGVG